jgi:Domain of unknown function (DUF4783)
LIIISPAKAGEIKNKHMKTNYFFSMIFLMASTIALFSFVQKDEIVDALKTGDAEKLSRHFDQTVDISMPGKSNSYSKGQAEMVLKDFFSMNKVRNFELQHSGSNPSSNFIIGKLTTANGSFRTTVYMRQRGDKQLIQGVEFENAR